MKGTINNWRWVAASARERYAMEHYTSIEQKTDGEHRLFIYHYSPLDPYQDANGATWNDSLHKWVN